MRPSIRKGKTGLGSGCTDGRSPSLPARTKTGNFRQTNSNRPIEANPVGRGFVSNTTIIYPKGKHYASLSPVGAGRGEGPREGRGTELSAEQGRGWPVGGRGG